MAADKSIKSSHVVFCGCAYFDVIPNATKEEVFASLRQGGVEVEAVADLCGLAAARDERLHRWAGTESLSIVSCYPRAIRWLFEAAGAPLDMRKVHLFNMRTQSPEEILSALLGDSVPQDGSTAALPEKQDGWVPWFPVIDYDQCKNCKQCMNFCLFGVYGLSDDGQVQVQNPSGCKTNCPACARMCPAQAIIFPKYADAPINGDEVTESDDAPAQPAPDLKAMLQGNVYDRIRQRQPGRKRFATESPKKPEPSCPTIDALRRDLDIPAEVLASLSPAELLRIRKTSQSDDSRTAEGDDANAS